MSDQMRADAGHGDKLRGRVSELVAKVLTLGQAGAADHYHVHPETVRRWLRRPKVALAYEEAVQAQRDGVLDAARSMAPGWLRELDTIIHDTETPVSVRVAAIRTGLDWQSKADSQGQLDKLRREHEQMKAQLEEARRAGTRRIEVVHVADEGTARPQLAGLLEGVGADSQGSGAAVPDGINGAGGMAGASNPLFSD